MQLELQLTVHANALGSGFFADFLLGDAPSAALSAHAAAANDLFGQHLIAAQA